MYPKIAKFEAEDGKTYKGLLVGRFMKVNPIPYFDAQEIETYLNSFDGEYLKYLVDAQILGKYCLSAQRYVLGNVQLPKIEHRGKTYFCFALDMHFRLKK